MRQTTAILLLLALIPCLSKAQKKELSQARTYIKAGNNLEQAERLMTELLKDTANRTNEKIYLTWYDAVRGQYEAANKRLYLKQNQDTAAFFELVRRQYTVLEMLDSVDALPDKKGKVVTEHRYKHATSLNTLRPNLYSAGMFHVRKSAWDKAFLFMDTYIDCANQPLFSSFNYRQTDTRLPEAAYWATYAGFMLNDTVRTLKYCQLALEDQTKAQFTYQYMAEAYRWKGDDTNYLQTLKDGFSRYPEFHYFFPRLSDFYLQRALYQEALDVANQAVAKNPSNMLFLLAQSTTLLALERYDESIPVSIQIIEQDESQAEAYFNAGSAYLNIALKLDETLDKEQVRELCQKALPYLEHYRELMPDAVEKWGLPLYRVYLNLNMGRQFDEIDRLLKSKT